jgi:hypothetical protein
LGPDCNLPSTSGPIICSLLVAAGYRGPGKVEKPAVKWESPDPRVVDKEHLRNTNNVNCALLDSA